MSYDYLPDWTKVESISIESALEALSLLKKYHDREGLDDWYKCQLTAVRKLANKAYENFNVATNRRNEMLDRLPENGLVRLDTILKFFPVSKSTWWAGVKTGRYPKSVKHGGSTFWKAEDIHELIRSITNGQE